MSSCDPRDVALVARARGVELLLRCGRAADELLLAAELDRGQLAHRLGLRLLRGDHLDLRRALAFAQVGEPRLGGAQVGRGLVARGDLGRPVEREQGCALLDLLAARDQRAARASRTTAPPRARTRPRHSPARSAASAPALVTAVTTASSAARRPARKLPISSPIAGAHPAAIASRPREEDVGRAREEGLRIQLCAGMRLEGALHIAARSTGATSVRAPWPTSTARNSPLAMPRSRIVPNRPRPRSITSSR